MKTLVELLTNQVGEKMVVVLALRLLYLLMTKHEWRPLFAREGGIYAVLVCMQEYKTSVLVQQAGLRNRIRIVLRSCQAVCPKCWAG